MEAYAALLSLMLSIDQIEEHPRLPISLDKQQVESLTKNVTFLQEYLEDYTSPIGDSRGADPLEIRIAGAASAAQVAIESYIVHVIKLARSTNIHEQDVDEDEISSVEDFDFGEENNSGEEMSSGEEEVGSDEEMDSEEDMSSEEDVSGIATDLGALTTPGKEEESCRQSLEQVIGEMELIKTQVESTVERKKRVAVENRIESDEVMKRIAKLRIGIRYEERSGFEHMSYYYFKNVELVQKLESLDCMIESGEFLQNVDLKKLSIKKLSLDYDGMLWEEKLNEIASLPLLEKLELYFVSFEERKWTTVKGQFRSLKFLRVFGCRSLKYWKTKSSHFPRLERLVLAHLKEIKKIPSNIGKIPTLKSIRMSKCKESMVISAKNIVEEKKALSGETSLKVRVTLWGKNEEMEKLASPPNFQVKVIII